MTYKPTRHLWEALNPLQKVLWIILEVLVALLPAIIGLILFLAFNDEESLILCFFAIPNTIGIIILHIAAVKSITL